MLHQINYENVHLLPGLFAERAEVNRTYLMELSKQGLLQNFYLEAGIVMPGLQVVDNPSTAELPSLLLQTRTENRKQSWRLSSMNWIGAEY